MSQVNCLNLCEIMHYLYESTPDFEEIINKAKEIAGFDTCERIYIGSYFCSQYFLHQQNKMLEALAKICTKEHIKLTLVVPTFSEKDLEKGKDQLKAIIGQLGELVDELTANDYGMLNYLSHNYCLKLNVGRLLMKDYRDPRHEAYFNDVLSPKIFTKYFEHFIERFHIAGLEFDPTHTAIDFSKAPEGLSVGVHVPYCYMTTGHICQFAAVEKDIDKKFRPNLPCAHECSSNLIRYDLQDGRQWLRVGKTIYFENRECNIYALDQMRCIFFPIDLEVKA